MERVRDPRAGAVVTFAGVTRDVDLLEYEAYAEMALEALREIVHGAIERHGLCAAAAEHRVGVVPLGEPSVLVAASAAHRGEAFAGAREMIDAIKARAPIWKVEVQGGERTLGRGDRASDGQTAPSRRVGGRRRVPALAAGLLARQPVLGEHRVRRVSAPRR